MYKWFSRFSVRHLAALMVATTLTVLIFVFQAELRRLAGFSYAGAFLLMLIGNATIILPAPALVFVYALGAQLDPVLIGLCAGVGGTIGELTGYLAGFGGSAIVSQTELHRWMRRYVEKYGLVAIVTLAIIPNPVFDVVGMAAGAMKMPVWKFLLAAWIGITIKTTFIALAGAYSITWIEGLIAQQ